MSITSVAGTSNTAPNPCAARIATSVPPSGANPHNTDVAPNTAMPKRNIDTAPNRPTAAAPASTRLANTITYASTTSCIVARLASRLERIAGIATLTMLMSITIIP